MKGKEGNCTRKSTSDSTNREKVDREARNIQDLVKRRGDTSSTMALDRARLVIGNGNGGMGGVG